MVSTPGGEWHSHGAAPERFMTHISMTEGDAGWDEHVREADFHREPG